jgi:hypothetical protein
MSPSDVQTVIGHPVGIPRSVVRGSTTDCTYSTGGSTQGVLIRFSTDASSSTFESEKSAYASLGHQLTSVSGIGDEAFSFSEQSGPQTKNALVVRSGTNQILVTGTPTMTQVETLARSALDKLNKTE